MKGKGRSWLILLGVLSVFAAGCGGNGGNWGGGITVDATAPRIILTDPMNQDWDVVPVNKQITATFSEAMDPATINTTTFTLTGPGTTPVSGKVSYVGFTAIFTPIDAFGADTDLAANTTYIAEITTGAQDLAGNALVPGDRANPWSFSTNAVIDVIPPEVFLTDPADGDTGVEINRTVNATFTKSMNQTTIIAGETFTLNETDNGDTVLGTITLSFDGTVATFTPTNLLTANTQYTAMVTAGAQDLAGNALVVSGLYAPNPWSFTTATDTGLAPGAIDLGRASTYGIMATAATTSTGPTMINGDVALNPGSSQGIPPPQVNGMIHVDDQVAIDAQTDLTAAYWFAKALPSDATIPDGTDAGAWAPPGSILSAGTLPPGVYTSSNTLLIHTPLTLDAGGNANAVWVFQIGSSLTTFVGGTPETGGNVLLLNGAQAKNVFFVPTSDVTIGINTTFNGSILAGRDLTGQTGATINGRLLAGARTDSTIALDSNTVNVPAP